MKIKMTELKKMIAEAVAESLEEMSDEMNELGTPPPIPAKTQDLKTPGNPRYKAAVEKLMAKGMTEKEAMDVLLNLEESRKASLKESARKAKINFNKK